jgi:hypothetical protein
MTRVRLWPWMGPLLLAACGGSESQDLVVRRDSVGIEIVESVGPRWGHADRWTVSADPLLDLADAGSGPDHEFFRIRNAIRLDDGRVAVANSGTNEVRFYDTNGDFVRSSGRTGEGPGEFERLTNVRAYRGDSLMAFDYWGRRISVMDATGEIARVASLTGLDGSLSDLYVLSGGSFLLHAHVTGVMAEAQGRIRIPAPLLSVRPDGTVEDTVTVVPGFETYVFELGDAAPPFRHEALVAVDDSLIYVGDGVTFEVKALNLHGEVQRIIRIPGYDLSVPRAVRDSMRVAMLQQEMPAQLRPTLDAMANSIPERRPAFSGILVDPLGFLWVQGYIRSLVAPGPRQSEVFDPDGQWLGTVELPDNFNLYQVGEDYLLGRHRDDLGVETIQVLELDRS